MLLPSYAPIIERVAPSVVALRRTRFPATGVAIAPRVVVTAAHAMGRGSDGEVTLADGRDVRAVLKGLDRRADLAVVEVDADLPVPEWGGDEDVKAGDVVIALGRPTGLLRASAGMVASIAGAWRTPRGVALDRFIDVDGALPPGFSGGPLVVGEGRIAGVNSALLVRGGTTIPTSTVRRLVDALLAGESTGPGFLGAGVQAVRLSSEQEGVALQQSGLLVTTLRDDGPAARAGVHVGDILLALADEPLASVASLLAALGGRADKQVTLTLLRGGEKRSIDVTLARHVERRGC